MQLVPPQGRARKPVPDEEPVEAEKVLAGLSWRRIIIWRQGTRGALAARFAAARIQHAGYLAFLGRICPKKGLALLGHFEAV